MGNFKFSGRGNSSIKILRDKQICSQRQTQNQWKQRECRCHPRIYSGPCNQNCAFTHNARKSLWKQLYLYGHLYSQVEDHFESLDSSLEKADPSTGLAHNLRDRWLGLDHFWELQYDQMVQFLAGVTFHWLQWLSSLVHHLYHSKRDQICQVMR